MQLDCFGQLGLDAEALGLMAYTYHPCLYFEMHCPDCGTFRLIVPVLGA